MKKYIIISVILVAFIGVVETTAQNRELLLRVSDDLANKVQQGNVDVQTILSTADIYYTNGKDPYLDSAAFKLRAIAAKKLAAEGRKEEAGKVEYEIAQMFEKKHVSPLDPKKASYETDLQHNDETVFKYYELASQHGYHAATAQLGVLYSVGSGVEQNREKAVACYKLAAENGDPGGMEHYANAIIDNDPEQGVELLQRAAEKGDRVAMFALSLIYEGGRYGIEKDLKKAAEWKQLSEQEGIDAAITAGKFADRERWQRYANTASSTELVVPTEQLRGGNYEIAKTPQNVSEAEKSFNTSAKQGVTDAKNQNQQLKTATDPYAALRTKAEKGDPEAMFQLAGRYYNDDKNYKAAYKWFIEAAKKGDNDAMLALYAMLENKQGTPKSMSDTKRLFLAGDMLQMAADYGNINAQYLYGALCYYSSGIPHAIVSENYKAARNYLEKVPVSSEYYRDAQKILAEIDKYEKLKQQQQEENKAAVRAALGELFSAATKTAAHVGVAAGLEQIKSGAGSQYLDNYMANNPSQTQNSTASSQTSGNYRVKYSAEFIAMKKYHYQMAGKSWPGFPEYEYFATEQAAINHLKEIFNSYSPPETYGLSGKNYTWVGTIEKIGQ